MRIIQTKNIVVVVVDRSTADLLNIMLESSMGWFGNCNPHDTSLSRSDFRKANAAIQKLWAAFQPKDE